MEGGKDSPGPASVSADSRPGTDTELSLEESAARYREHYCHRGDHVSVKESIRLFLDVLRETNRAGAVSQIPVERFHEDTGDLSLAVQ